MMRNLVICLLFLLMGGMPVGMYAQQKDVCFRVLQLNLWNGTTKVPGGYEGFIGLLERTDPDVVFLCEMRDSRTFLPRVIAEMERRGRKYYGESFGLAVGILSKLKPDSLQTCCTVEGNEERTFVKLTATVGDCPLAFYACHLDHRHYECYLPRGYSGTTWKKIDAPVTDADTVLSANRLAYRDESVRAFLEEARRDRLAGRAVILGGDFNEPSHLDWLADTRLLWDHHGAVIPWDCSLLLARAGFRDAYRERHPDVVRCPGFTFPAGNREAERAGLEKLAWAPEADERDRIDFIYYRPDGHPLQLKDCVLVGPRETVLRGKIVANDTDDSILTPDAVWPSDHKGNLATFVISH